MKNTKEAQDDFLEPEEILRGEYEVNYRVNEDQYQHGMTIKDEKEREEYFKSFLEIKEIIK